jgi:hypothetical protein
MALDGHCPSSERPVWTIKVWATPQLAAERDRWSGQRQTAFHQIAADLAYMGVDAIQARFLRTRRESLWHAEGEVRYFFRRDKHARRTILITIFKIDFHFSDCDPPKPGASAPRPLDPLVIDVSGSGKRYSIDYVEGVLPRPPRTNRIERLKYIYATDNAHVSVYELASSLGYSYPRVFCVGDDGVHNLGHLHLRKKVKRTAWEMSGFSRCPDASSTAGVAGPFGAISDGISRLAITLRNDVDISSTDAGTIDACHGLSLPSRGVRNTSAIQAERARRLELPKLCWPSRNNVLEEF